MALRKTWTSHAADDAVREALKEGTVPKDVFDTALSVTPNTGTPISPRLGPHEALFLFEYEDGLLGAQFMLQLASRMAVALKLKGDDRPIATQFEERREPRYPHFAFLLKAIERMMHTGKPSYPVEQTLLTSGILDRAITSRARRGKRLMTPELGIRYHPVDYPHAPNPDLKSNPLAAASSSTCTKAPRSRMKRVSGLKFLSVE